MAEVGILRPDDRVELIDGERGESIVPSAFAECAEDVVVAVADVLPPR